MTKIDVSPSLAIELMERALEKAQQGAQAGEVPIGAALWKAGAVVASSHNRVEELCDVSAHAEVLVLKEAARLESNWRLDDAILCVTLEPCVMCLGAIERSRVSTVILGASDSRQGACGGRIDLAAFFPHIRIIRDVQKERCAKMLEEFFKSRRSDRS